MLTKSETLDNLRSLRRQIDAVIATASDTPAVINAIPSGIRPWKPGPQAVGDVRAYEGVPYKCVQAHDSSANPNWTPAAYAAGWAQYHGTSPDTARPYAAPTGAHDAYMAGEYMVWTDGQMYKCVQDGTVYGPDALAAAWTAE